MATFKAEVYAHQKKQDGTYNIKIRVTHNRKKKYMPTTYYVKKEDLTRNLKLKNQYYIDETEKLIQKYRQICNRIGERLKTMTVEQIVELISVDNTEDHFDLDFVQYGRKLADDMKKTGHTGNSINYCTAINSLVKFAGRDNISIKEINVRFLNDYLQYLGKQQTQKKGNRAESLYLGILRSIHNKAKLEFNNEDIGVIRIPLSPFKKIDIPKHVVTKKRALDIEQIRRIAELKYNDNPSLQLRNNNRFNLAKDLFILSFCLIGMNATDLYNCTNLKNERITYNRMKTKNRRADRAEISIRIEPEIKKLVDKYRDLDGRRVFCFHKMYSSVNTFNAALNKGLKAVGSLIGVNDLEFYAARHTWATIATNEAGVDKFTVHSALNHIDESMKVTDIYIRKSWDPIDKANRKVLDYVNLYIESVDESE